ncbi:MAG TPA: lamin tail domain-containing protein [Flavisolibacter sp.]
MKTTFTTFHTAVLTIVFHLLLSLSANAQANHVVISQVFGGGGLNASHYNRDFVELYNPTSAPVDLAGWTVQYSAIASTTFVAVPLSGTIPSKTYFLIGLGSNNLGVGTALPLTDVSQTTPNISSTSFKIALVNNTTLLTGHPNPASASVDFLGTGTANFSEGAVAAAGSNTTSLLRKANASSTAATHGPGGDDEKKGSGYDSDNNAADFVLMSAVTARNSNIHVLPVSFTSFRATNVASGIQVEWQVAGERYINQYIIERAADGRIFQPVAEIKAVGNASYKWTDQAPYTTENYYRIRSVDNTGSDKYSAIVFINAGQEKLAVTLFPNPARGGNLTLQFHHQPKGRFTVQAFSAAGQEVQRSSIDHAGGFANYSVPVNAIRGTGVYYLKISNGTEQSLIRLMRD